MNIPVGRRVLRPGCSMEVSAGEADALVHFVRLGRIRIDVQRRTGIRFATNLTPPHPGYGRVVPPPAVLNGCGAKEDPHSFSRAELMELHITSIREIAKSQGVQMVGRKTTKEALVGAILGEDDDGS